MRSLPAVILGGVVAALAAWLACYVLQHDSMDAPGWLCTVAWVVAVIVWLIWAFPNYLRG